MKIERITKQTGAFFRPRYKEVNEEISKAKGDIRNNVSDIIVEVQVSNGTYNFQGDEDSQNRLARNGWSMEKTNTQTIKWKTSDNQIVDLTISDIAEIILASSQQQTTYWL